MNITVLGMGKIGHSVSCYLIDKGCNVKCWDRDSSKLDVIGKGICCTGVLEGSFMPSVESDIEKAISDA